MAETIDDTGTHTISVDLTEPKGQLVSMDAPDTVKDGATVLISGRARNVGDAPAGFALEVWDGPTRIVGDGTNQAMVLPAGTFGFNNASMIMPARNVTLTFKVMRY